jgi:SAM-dependent methyltransferase
MFATLFNLRMGTTSNTSKQCLVDFLSKWIIVFKNILNNYFYKLRKLIGSIETIHGATHHNLQRGESLRYINTVFSDYLSFSGLCLEDLEGKRILEIGPGDNFGVALLFIAYGASEVICLDRFKPFRNLNMESTIYHEIRRTLSERCKLRFDEAVDLTKGIQFNNQKLKIIYGLSIEDTANIFNRQSFDMIISRAVLMEISDLDLALENMDNLLRPGGLSLHKVAPLHDYMMFRQHGHHPLEFLTIPTFLYRRMVSDSGRPNRKLQSYYQKRFGPPKYVSKIYTTALLGGQSVAPVNGVNFNNVGLLHARRLLNEILPRLPQQYRVLPEEDLLVEDLFISAIKN